MVEDRVLVFSPGFANTGPFRAHFRRGEIMGSPMQTRGIAVIALAATGRFTTGTPAPPREPRVPAPPGFRLVERREAETFTLVRFRAPRPLVVTPKSQIGWRSRRRGTRSWRSARTESATLAPGRLEEAGANPARPAPLCPSQTTRVARERLAGRGDPGRTARGEESAFVPGTTAQSSAIVHATRFPLIVRERHAVALDPLLLDDAREELLHGSPPDAPWRWGYLLGVHSERGTHPAAVRLSRVVRERLAAQAFSLSFVKLAVGTPPSASEGPLHEGPHLDSHPALTDSTELLRLLVNLSEHPRRFLYAVTDRWRLGVREGRRDFVPLALPPEVERRVVVIPGRTSTTVHALRFLASAVPHVGLNDPPEHFLLSFEALVASAE